MLRVGISSFLCINIKLDSYLYDMNHHLKYNFKKYICCAVVLLLCDTFRLVFEFVNFSFKFYIYFEMILGSLGGYL